MNHILLVDDEPDILESTAELLRAYGFQVTTCSEAEEVVPAIRQQRPDVVLHDVRMPGMELARQVRAIRAEPGMRKVPVILFTATLAAKDLAESVGADDGVEKPFDTESLKALLDHWARKSSG